MNDNRRFNKEKNNRPERRPERRADRFAERPAPVEEVEGQIEGRNALTEALRAGRTIDKVFVAEGDTDRSLQRLAAQAKEAGAVIVPVDRRKLDQMSTTRSHQGVIALVAAHDYYTVDDILEEAASRGENALIVICDELSDPHNLGAIMRTAECAGAHGVIIPKRRSVGLTATVAKASAGAVEYMKVARVTNISNTINELKEKGVWVFGTAAEGSIPMYKADLTGPAAIVIGNEGDGMSQLVRKNCDVMVHIPMNEKDLELEELSLEEIMREFGSTEEMAEPVDAQELLAMFDSAAEPETEQPQEALAEEVPAEASEEAPAEAPEEKTEEISEEEPVEVPEETAESAETPAPDEDAAPELGDTVRLDDLSGIAGEVPTFAQPLSDETRPIGSIWDEEEQHEDEQEQDEDNDEVTIPTPIIFRPKQRLRELKRDLIAGPERRYYELAEIGVGKLQLAMFVCFAVVLICGGAGFLYSAGMLPENRLRLMVFGQVLAMLIGALMGCQQMIEGVSDLFRGRFTLNTLLLITFGASCADAWLCLQELRVPICAAFTLAVLMSLWATYHRRTTEMGQMDTMRKASRLDGVVKYEDYLDGKTAYLRGEGQVADFMEHYDEIPRPERIQNSYALVALLVSIAIAVFAYLRHGTSMAVRIFSTTLLVAVPASFFITITRPMAVLERRLHRLGAVLCGWTGIKDIGKKALFPLKDEDLFPKGSSKLNGVKFYGKRAPEVVISYAAAMMEANGGSLAPMFEELLVSRSGLRHNAYNLQYYGNGGIGGEVCEEPVLMGSLHFLKEMGVEIPEGTAVKQAVYVAIDGELSGLFAISYTRTKYTATGLATLCGNRKLKPVILAEDFMVTASFLKEKFGVRTKRMIFPSQEVRQELLNKKQTEGTTAMAMTTVEGLAPVACAITGARAVRTAWKLGLVIHLLGGILGLLVMASLAYLGNTELLTPLNILAYQLIWAVPGVLVTFWPRTV